MNEEFDNWEEVPDEELWENGELSEEELRTKIFIKVRYQGTWKLIRRIQ